MEKVRFKTALKNSFSLAACCFSVSIFLVAIFYSIGNLSLPPVAIVKIGILFLILGSFTVVRTMFGNTRWAMDKPFYIKSLIFMPLYMVVSIAFALSILRSEGVQPNMKYVIFYAAIFLVTFTIRQFVEYFKEKAKTDKMNDALKEFQKEHSWDEEE